MEDKYMSIITNFGCHYKCPYCVVKTNGLEIPKTTMQGLDNLVLEVDKNRCNIISVSGGGDPLFEYEKHKSWYSKLFHIAACRGSQSGESGAQNRILRPLPIEMHTSCMTDETTFPFYKCKRVVYHANTYGQLNQIRRTGEEIVRVVYVVTEDFTENQLMDIARYVRNSKEIDELSFRQLVKRGFETSHHLEEFLRAGHREMWWYIEQCYYNLYYAEGKVYRSYSEFGKR